MGSSHGDIHYGVTSSPCIEPMDEINPLVRRTIPGTLKLHVMADNYEFELKVTPLGTIPDSSFVVFFTQHMQYQIIMCVHGTGLLLGGLPTVSS